MKPKSPFQITLKPHGGIPAKKLRRFESIINRELNRNGKITQEAWSNAVKVAAINENSSGIVSLVQEATLE